MTDVLLKLEWFIIGFGCGLVAIPFSLFLTRLIEEVKIAKQQWRKGPDQ